MAFAFLLWLYVQDQRSYDQHYKDADLIYRVNADFSMNGKRDIYSNAPRPMGPTLNTDFPEVTASVRMYGVGGLLAHTGTLVLGDKRIKSEKFYIADSSVFSFFDQQFIAGNPSTALTEPNSLVLTTSLAKKFFPDGDAYGKTLQLPDRELKNLKITGIVADPSPRTHLPVEAWVSWTTFPYEPEMTQWYGAHVYTYIKLNPASNIKELHEKFPVFFDKYMKQTFADLNGTADVIFQPLKEIHLAPEYVWEPSPHGSETNVYMLGITMIFLLVISSINYVNLATARAAERASEVGIRKTLGSRRRLLLGQFLGESLLLALISGLVALIFSLLMLPYFNRLSGLTLTITSLLAIPNLAYLALFSFSIGIFAGLYPAFYLVSFKPVQVLKGKFATSNRGEVLRKILVVSQYSISAILIAGILFVAEQTAYIKNKDIGYQKENLIKVNIQGDSTVTRHLDSWVQDLLKNSNIVGVTRTGYSLSQEGNHFTPTLENPDGTTFQTGVDFITVDYDFVRTLGASLLHGRNFDRQSGTDESTSILINETAMKNFGWQNDPLAGKFVNTFDVRANTSKFNVIGVVKDFNLGASYQNVHPMMLFLDPEGGRNLYVRIDGQNIFSSTDLIRESWAERFPGYPFEYVFLDEELAALYTKEENFLQLLTAFSAIIILITSLGIIGLISFTTELKRKEIAIRKVNGSPIKNIVFLLSKKFVTLLLTANILAIPVAYYFINLWLDTFAYRVPLSAGPFVIALFVSAFFTGVSLLYHTMRAARANPVEALRYE
jgi:putative ABC transport system permease protein